MDVNKLKEFYQNPLPSTRSGSLYNAFSYPTKISPEVISIFIATHTKPGETILDTFSGSGTTGLATLLCDQPTEKMKAIASELDVTPIWGPRNAYLYEVGVLGSFLSRTLCKPPNPDIFMSAVTTLLNKAQEKIGWCYQAKDLKGDEGVIRHIIWSDVLICPHCQTETTYWDASVRYNPLKMDSSFTCTSCNKSNEIKNCNRVVETITDDFTNLAHERKKRVPVRVHGQTGKTKWQRKPTKDDLDTIFAIEQATLPSSAPNKEIAWGDLYRSGYHKGITHLHHFYTRRNFYVLSTLWDLVSTFDKDIQDHLRLLILSYNATHSTLMTRVVVKKNQNDFVLTGAQSGVLYISGLPVEKNILLGLIRKASALKKAFMLVQNSTSKVTVSNTSSEKISLPNSSIDYVFTDPPFGDFIPYAELNQINELWLGSTTNRKNEIIISKALDKTVETYAQMMEVVFSEISRLLKTNAVATVVFHSAKAEIWRALTHAYTKAGLNIQTTSVLDKVQASFKQTVSTVSVKGDPLLLLSKDTLHKTCNINANDIMEEILTNVTKTEYVERTPERMYSRFVTKCLELGIEITIDAKIFYAHAMDAIGER